MSKESKEELKSAILKSLETEIDTWLEQEGQITDGYDYETKFLEVVRRMNRILLEKSMGKLPGSHNEKKTSNHFREDRSS
ncbi:hypothetical protein [Niabella drilacis]|uniref:Uncharacterized protein n=1 Tax=Niabella drilacis (strain DSM 25811 / CCM 8410 / CCUG 62505 / LMG 26954 / E90) TaxID=1285928 RepID=A0A1G6MQU3_NIADE|nr:hypothetical protein [Niabella drilacis]SDC57882.1 hypothetical protein SAMN04487894_1032 [Niabella drilacis]SDE14773.1 hypothetical protein SAMN04487894_12339 [Niabella drilacis]SDE32549.1 hypothetical protein SAMN04487894_1361 [Niabella drilacis]